VIDARGLLVPSLLFPPPSLSLSPVLVCFSLSSYSFLGVLLLSSYNVRRAGFKSAAACTAAGLGSVVASELFSCTVSNVDFPLGPRNGIFVEACNDDWSPLLDSDTLCLPVLNELGGGGASFVGVAPRMLILGGADGAAVVDDVFVGPASSAFFPITEAMPVCRAETRDEGGGLFNRGDAGHCGVVSPEAGPELFVGPVRAGSLDTASVTAPLSEESWGTLLADKALCIAAAEGCDENDWLPKAPGRLSLRIGDVFREDLGLDVVDEEDGSRDAECCLRNVGVCMEEEDEDTVFWRVALGLLRWTVAVEEADDISEEPSEGGPDGRSMGCSAWPFMGGRVSWVLVGIV
jgi:hypothetical protein